MAITAQQKANLLGVTSFMFNFAPDQASFARFEAIIEANPSFYALGTNLARTEAYTSQFAEGATRAEKIDLILGRLGLTEGEGYERGVDFINQRLDAGIPEGQVLMEIGEKLLQDTPPTGLEDAAAILKNKIAASEAYLESGIVGYSSETLPDLLANITADAASVEEAQAAIDEIKPGVPGDNLSLTAGTDTLTGTENDDVFTAGLSAVQDGGGLSEFQTLNDGDIIDGGAGNDRLNAVLNTANTAPESITNVEEIYVQSRTTAGGNTLDMTNVSGVEQLWNDRSTRDLTVTNLSDEVVLGLNQVRQGTNYEVTATYDIISQDVVLQGAGRAPTQGGGDAATLTLNSNTAGSITALNLVAASGLNNVLLAGDLDNVALADLSVTGAGDLILNAATAFAGLESVSAGEATGNLVLNISGSAVADLAVVTGSGDDTVTIDGALVIAANDELVINLGEGENTLGLTGLASETGINGVDFTAGTISGVDALEIGNDGNSGITLAAAAELDLAGTATSDITFNEVVNLATFDFAFANTQDTLDLSFAGGADAGAATPGSFDLGDTATSVTIGTGAAVGATGAVGFTGEALQSLTINAEADFNGAVAGADFNTDGTVTSLSELTLNDNSENGDSSFTIGLENTADLATIDLTGVTATYDEVAGNFVGGDVTIDAETDQAEFGGAVTINVGSAALTYTADAGATASVREAFVFTAEDINDISITNFDAGAGANRDRLDFSQFEGISSTEDLNIVAVNGGADVEITAADGQFNGTITLVGVAADAALNESLDFA